MAETSAIHVGYESGEELLTAYWGYLTGGGLIIADPGVEVGDGIALRVTIVSSKTEVRLQGTVVKREPDSQRAIIAFRAGEAHDMLLSQAMAESENVAPRRYARFHVDKPIVVKVADSDCSVRLVNLSMEGCCLALRESQQEGFEMGSTIMLVHGEIHAIGTIVWRQHLERGIKMTADESRPLMQKLCSNVC